MYEVAAHFYARSVSARTSSHWEHLDQFSPEMFRETEWLDTFLSRWVSVGFNDTTMKVPGRFELKRSRPLERVVLNDDCVAHDRSGAKRIVGLFQHHFSGLGFVEYLGCEAGKPICPLTLTGKDRTISLSFHEMSLLYMALRLRALVEAAEVEWPLRLLEIGGGMAG